MSRAFVRKSDGDTPDDGLPERPESAQPNYVTAQGLKDLREQLANAFAEQTRLRSASEALASKAPLARLSREIRYLERRIESAILVSASEASEKIQIGANVTIDDGTRRMNFIIVGEDQADPARGLISWSSPLGRALVGSTRGAKVLWERPVGDIEVTIVDFTT